MLARVRRTCLGFPGTSERLSHGAPAFFVDGKRCFVMVADDHHGDGRFALWCAATREAQAALVASDGERFFVPPYVGPSGWIGVRLDRRAPWATIAGVLEQAYEMRAAPARRRPR